MELYKEDVLQIFRKNFTYPIVQTPLGEAIKMDAINAFLFANITGAGYFDNPMFLFSPKGTQKTLREAFQYHLVTGIYNGASLFYSPIELIEKRPYLFTGDKYIVFKEFTDEYCLSEALQDEYDELVASGHTPTDYIIARIEASKVGNGMEPFLEYLICEHFKKLGYIVENQVPLTANVGSPDFGGYRICGRDQGFHINELSLIRVRNEIELAQSFTVSSAVVGEAKTATTIMAKQLRKYLDTGLFAKGYEMHPDKSKPSLQSFGLFNIQSDYSIKCSEPTEEYEANNSSDYNHEEYIAWIHQYLKFYLMANFTQQEFDHIIKSRIGRTRYSSENVINAIMQMETDEIIMKLKEVM